MLDIGLLHRKEYDISDRSEPAVIAEAPGRVHFLGEHGEPGAGLYLSAAIDRRVQVAISIRKDNSLRFYAADLGERKRTTLINLKFKREDRWANYIKVAIHLFAELGLPVKGFSFTIIGDIPQQVGLGSSSAIELASAVALRNLLRVRISDQELLNRLIAAHALFFGNNADMVDYLIGLSARKDQFLLLDEASLEAERIKSPFSRCKVILVDSRVPRLGVESELNARREDIKAGLELLSQSREGASLREYATSDLVDYMGHLLEEIRRRSMHVVQEIRRVYDAGDCLRCQDIPGFSKIIYHSHESLRDLFEISCPETDWLVKRAQETEGVFGSRMTGQGFGGCTYALVKNDMVEEYKKRLEDYERIFGFRPVIHEVRIGTASRVVPK
ncbi:MAG: galactokinase [Treponema sp.]|jgi:galactokinase|nr:galactokinase [Treponema sp.]